jgi:SulP family sulfate permease
LHDFKEIIARLFPILTWRNKVSPENFKSDLIAGLTGAVLVLPQGVAFAMIAGLPPIYGLYTAVVSTIIGALFSSSNHTVNGPTTALSIVTYSALEPLAVPGSAAFVELAILITLIAGAIQLFLGWTKMGSLVNFVSNTVVVGFTAGAALLIGASQLKHFLGIPLTGGLNFFQTLKEISFHIESTNVWVLLVSGTTLGIAILIKSLLPKWPYMLLAMIVGSGLALSIHGISHGISFVDHVEAGFPGLKVPSLSGAKSKVLLSNAFALALLGLIQSVAIARSIASKSGQRIDPNQEFIAQGLANIVGSFFRNYTAGASFTRSAVNYLSGAKTPLSAIVSAVLVLIILLFIAPFISLLPIPAMAGIIFIVAYNLIDFDAIKMVLKSNLQEKMVLLVTFASTLFLNLEYAIYFGVLLSLVFYLQRTSKPRIIKVAPDENHNRRKLRHTQIYSTTPCPQLDIIRIDGSLFFGATDYVAQYLFEQRISGKKHLLLLGDGINFIDLTGAELLIEEAEARRSIGGALYLTSFKKVARDFLEAGGYAKRFGEDNIYLNKTQAIEGIYAKLDKSICEECTVRVFSECKID